MFDNVLVEFGALAGFSALVSLIVNVLKFVKVVKDGDAQNWIAGFNLVGVLALYGARLFIPDFDPLPINNIMSEIAVVGGFVMGYVGMLYGSKITYIAVKGLPLIGKSNTPGVGKQVQLYK